MSNGASHAFKLVLWKYTDSSIENTIIMMNPAKLAAVLDKDPVLVQDCKNYITHILKGIKEKEQKERRPPSRVCVSNLNIAMVTCPAWPGNSVWPSPSTPAASLVPPCLVDEGPISADFLSIQLRWDKLVDSTLLKLFRERKSFIQTLFIRDVITKKEIVIDANVLKLLQDDDASKKKREMTYNSILSSVLRS